MDNSGSITPVEERRAKGIRVAGTGFILIFMSGIMDILTLNMLWPLLTITGLFLVIAGLWMAKKN